MRWHWRIAPFAHGFQNWMETWLFFSSGVMVTLAAVYTLLPEQVRAACGAELHTAASAPFAGPARARRAAGRTRRRCRPATGARSGRRQ